MSKLMDTVQVDTIHDWEVRHLCDGCEHTTRFLQPDNQVVNLGVSGSVRGMYCQNCKTAVGDRSLATGRIYEIAIGKPRRLTTSESKRLKRAVDQLDEACRNGYQTRFLRSIDRLLGLFVQRYQYMGLEYQRAYLLVPKDLRQLIDDLDTVYFKEG